MVTDLDFENNLALLADYIRANKAAPGFAIADLCQQAAGDMARLLTLDETLQELGIEPGAIYAVTTEEEAKEDMMFQ